MKKRGKKGYKTCPTGKNSQWNGGRSGQDGHGKDFFDELGKELGTLSASRQQAKVWHKLGGVVATVLFSLLSDVDEWSEKEYFVIDQRDTLRKYLELLCRIPLS